jgi:hypothetical protein
VASHAKSGSPRTPGQIQADLAATRRRLISSVETLIDQVHPNRVKQRTVAKLKYNLKLQLDNAKAWIFNSRGDLRKDRLVAVGGGAAGLITFVSVIRALRRRRNR